MKINKELCCNVFLSMPIMSTPTTKQENIMEYLEEKFINITEFDQATKGFKLVVCVAGTEHYISISKRTGKDIMQSGYDYARLLVLDDDTLLLDFA